ncbi:MAG: succinate CoA transferase [Methylococcales bacterium]|nr:MAG: succinate CoA transferase [Methylococcales bacterium]
MTQYPLLTPEEAASIINHNDMVAFSGFTAAGSPKVIPLALAQRATALHEKGEDFAIRLMTGASVGAQVDDALAAAKCVSWRAPYQSASGMRKAINNNEVEFVDMHLGEVAQMLRAGFFGEIEAAVIEAVDVTPDGRVFLTSGIGNSPTFLERAKKIIIERNSYFSSRITEFADNVTLPNPPKRPVIPLYGTMDKIGKPYVQIDPAKIIGIVETHQADQIEAFTKNDETSVLIAHHVETFLLKELKAGRIPKDFLPIQSGVGNINNAVMDTLGKNPDIPKFTMFSEVLQESVVDLILEGKVTGISASSLTITPGKLQTIFDNMDFFSDKIVLRPQEISNNPELIRRLGVIALNVGLEFDIYGHANSSHVLGSDLMNGIGGSGDFERNAYLSVFMAPSTAKGGKISSIVPMCTHVDHSEHSVKVIITEQGIADLRGLSPSQRAHSIIENCVHPMYKEVLYQYLSSCKPGHIAHDLHHAFDMHVKFLETGCML